MITKLALLARNLPALFRRLPAVTSVGYRMPHKRFFFAGISFSAALHAAVLFGIRAPVPPPPVEPDSPEKILAVLKFDVVPEELPPPPPEIGAKTNEEKPAANGENASRFPEPSARPINDAFTSILVPPDLGKMPTAGPLRWEVPRNASGAGVNAKTTKIFRKEDLDKVPVPTSRVSPRYPSELKREGIAGTVLLRFVVDTRGNVSSVEVVRADRPEFGRSASEAMLRWTFRAGMKDGSRVNTLMEMPMVFSVESGV